MSEKNVKQSQEELLALARRAGLDTAVEKFPEDVLAAADAAAKARSAYAPPDNPAAEPWPPMRTGART